MVQFLLANEDKGTVKACVAKIETRLHVITRYILLTQSINIKN